MKRFKENNLFSFLKINPLTTRSTDQLKELFNFNLNMELPQRKLVELGQVIGRVVSMDMVHRLSDEGFRKDLIRGGINMLHEEIQQLMSTFRLQPKDMVVEDYHENSSWLRFSV